MSEFPAEWQHLLPTDDEVQFYQIHGYYKSKVLFSEEEIDAALAASNEFYKGEVDSPPLPGKTYLGWTPDKGDVLRKNDHASFQKRGLSHLTQSPLLGAVAARLAQTPEIRLWHDQLLYKPVDQPDRKANVGWHTDRGYWKTCSSQNLLTAWIPFHDCNQEMGTITMIDGSHLWPDNTANLDFFSNDLEGLEARFRSGGNQVIKVPMNLKKGEVSFHHCLTIHGSGPNHSQHPRRSIAVHLQDQANHWQEFHYEDGTLARHDNDGLVRQNEGVPDYSDPAVCPVLWSQS